MRYKNPAPDKDGTRLCVRCGEWKSLEAFQVSHGYLRRICRNCVMIPMLVAHRRWTKTEKGRAASKRCGERQRQTLRWKLWKKEYAKKSRARNPVAWATYQKRYKSSWRGRLKASEYKNRRRGRIGLGKIDPAYWKILLDAFDGQCAFCRKQAANTVDHIVPLSRGGLHENGNVIPACRLCNVKKGNRPKTLPIPISLRATAPEVYRALVHSVFEMWRVA